MKYRDENISTIFTSEAMDIIIDKAYEAVFKTDYKKNEKSGLEKFMESCKRILNKFLPKKLQVEAKR